MTVSELMTRLEKCNPNLQVTVDSDGVDLYSFEITNVFEREDQVELYGNYTEYDN